MKININFGFFSILGVLFIALKLINIIHWSWWWVLTPIWAPFALLIAFFIAVVLAGLVGALFS